MFPRLAIKHQPIKTEYAGGMKVGYSSIANVYLTDAPNEASDTSEEHIHGNKTNIQSGSNNVAV